jgi:general stress protein 26
MTSPKAAKSARTQSIAKKFITGHRAAALATVSQAGLPHVATVFCLTDAKLNIYFMTRTEARKYRNLAAQPAVAMSFTDEATMATVQVSGTAVRIDNIDLELEWLYKLVSLRYSEALQLPPSMQQFDQEHTAELAVIKVTPAELTHTEFLTTLSGRYHPTYTKVI